ncbi:helix-turn-helix domain-containing protein [Chitinophaga filiformis]|uniref:helix-turn-helix domain-containing protein n=1 Tax=Chitinophaga filiformis TaxID=104663 RepID=UPI001F35B02C|nr:helix-turn-helix domain-containing protein [Chitinophaga filiformis]MCF6404310.1 helix-turn-helix domain-containing protein [Chitinophaga filiformis]
MNDRQSAATGYITGHIPVPEEWDQVFDPFYYAANHQESPIRRKFAPSFQTILIFNFGTPGFFYLTPDEPLPVENSIVIGPIKLSHDYVLSPGTDVLIANFKLDAFYRFFGRHLQSYTDFMQHPDELLGEHCFANLWQELKQLPDMQQRVNRILDFSAAYLVERDEKSEDIVAGSHPESVINPIKEIAGKQGQSERSIQLKYKKYLGYSAKEISRYQRYKKALAWLQERAGQNSHIDWFEIIHEFGYYDQSHLIHDFNHFLGVSPAQYVKLQASICIAAGRP